MNEARYTEAQKRSICSRLSELPPSSRTKEIYALILDYARKTSTVQVKRLGNKTTAPFGARKLGDDYTFEINNLPEALLAMIEKLLETE
jgi:hypothetical protein